MATPSCESDGLSRKKYGSVWWSRAVSPPWNSSTMWLESRIGSTPLISWVSGPITPLMVFVSIWFTVRELHLLGLRADHPADGLRQHLVHRGHAVSDVAAGVARRQLHFAAEHSAGRVDLTLGHLGPLDHGLPETGQPAREAGKNAIGDRSGGTAAGSARSAARRRASGQQYGGGASAD